MAAVTRAIVSRACAALLRPRPALGWPAARIIPFSSSPPQPPPTGPLRDVAAAHLDFSAAGAAGLPPSVTPAAFGVAVYSDFVTEDEEKAAVDELRPSLPRRYEDGHWDGVISGYREAQRALTVLSPALRAVAGRVHAAFPPSAGPPLPFLHVLDLKAEADGGRIDRHVDSVKFSGGVVAGVCLLSPAVMTLHHEASAATVTLSLPRRCLYTLTGAARYEWGHSVRAPARRISLMFRDELVGPPPTVTPLAPTSLAEGGGGDGDGTGAGTEEAPGGGPGMGGWPKPVPLA
jgi:alkylated DNA repair protein alkB family protein 7